MLFGDYSDPDVVRVGEDYYLVSSSFQAVPALPILHSRDLVNWTIVAHAAPRLPSPDFDRAQHGNGIWAPSLRHHGGFFWIYAGDPDRGIYMTRSRDPRGPWEPLTLVQEAKGWIDPCPLWDDDGSMVLVHAWAKSRAGVNGILTVRRMSPDGRRVLGEGVVVFDGRDGHPTIEGPKFYKRNGWYYIFAPAGGVKTGWQTVLRSKNLYGPYEAKIVLDQGSTSINGPHQGAWVETPDGTSWFLHFQDRGAYGRIVHLQPMSWLSDWPVIGDDRDGDGKGEPVLVHRAPGGAGGDTRAPQTTDEFDGSRLGLQWQWHGNPGAEWYSLKKGVLKLSAIRNQHLWSATSLLLQKLPAPSFTATTRIDATSLRAGERAGLVVMGSDYSTLVLERSGSGLAVTRGVARDADQGAEEKTIASTPVSGPAFLRVSIEPEAVARFAYSLDGATYLPLGGAFVARPGRWIGAKVGLFASAPLDAKTTGSAEFDFFRIENTAAEPHARGVRIALAGDSTMTDDSGWGSGFQRHVAPDAAVLNFARGGRSSKSFREEGHWDELLRQRPSHVLIQFGHNDMAGKGLARETTLPVYRGNLARYVDEARGAGAEPILVTPLTRRYFDVEGRVRSDLEAHAEATRHVAAEKKATLVDLHARSIELLDSLGSGISPALGPLKADGTLDKTHLNESGSALIGALMAEEVRRAAPSLQRHVRPPRRPAVTAPWSVRMAESEMKRTPDPMWLDATTKPRWEYTPGLVLKSILDVFHRTGDERLLNYVEAYYDGMINEEGEIAGGYRMDEYNIDRINPGKPLFFLYAKTKDEKYRQAIELLREQMRKHPRTSESGFWHKKRYPWQMWLDGLYMGAPFLAQYAVTFDEPALLGDIITQFVLMEKNARDPKTGLLYHGWDESRQQKWADPKTGRSPEFWGRAMGWFAMGLVETLDFVPATHPRRGELTGILQRLAAAVVKVQDPKSGVWWQVVDKGGREGNYLESSVSSMLSFALMRASRLGLIDPKYGQAGRRAYEGILEEFIEVDDKGLTNIHRVCQVAGLGGDPEKGERYRSGTFEYYISETIRSNDPKATGPFIFASLEYERTPLGNPSSPVSRSR
ncbi:MAG TPA: glycoside hydrolase family 88 protein [Thermoanaerobaculia bacterium]|nr:glycoside hydrolase family 88 protein [Thermoanaerobaculia bacterium]